MTTTAQGAAKVAAANAQSQAGTVGGAQTKSGQIVGGSYTASPSQVSNAISSSLGNAVTATNNPGDNPHDALGYNPATDLTSSAYNPNASTAQATTAVDTSQPTPIKVGATTGVNNPQAPNTQAQLNPNDQAPQGLVDQVGKASQAVDQLKQKYGKALTDINSTGVTAPANAGSANAGINAALSSQPKETPPTPAAVTSFLDPSQNPAADAQMTQLREFLNPESDRKMLDESISQLSTDRSELRGLKTDLMNIKNVMSGTEQDLRDEITKAGGFASESQVQGLAVARNKGLLKQATLLQDQIQSQTDLVNSDISLVGDEKQLAAQKFSQNMSILQYAQTNYNNQLNAARDSIKMLLGPNMENAASVYKAVQGTAQEGRYEQVLGLPAGGLSQLAKTSNIDSQIKQATLAHTLAETNKINSDLSAQTPGTPSYDKNQDKLEQQYRQVLLKEASSRSGDLGIQNQKVSQAIHLTSLLNQYKDSKGNYNVPTAQYAELAMGLANLLSPSGSAESDRQAIMSKTAAGNIKEAIQYITGTPQNGNTQEIIKNLADSIDRQGGVAEDLRDQATRMLQGLVPTGLDQSRVDALNRNGLPSYSTFKSTGKVGDKSYTAPKLLQPAEIPTGYYQASDGLLYPKQ